MKGVFGNLRTGTIEVENRQEETALDFLLQSM